MLEECLLEKLKQFVNVHMSRWFHAHRDRPVPQQQYRAGSMISISVGFALRIEEQFTTA